MEGPLILFFIATSYRYTMYKVFLGRAKTSQVPLTPHVLPQATLDSSELELNVIHVHEDLSQNLYIHPLIVFRSFTGPCPLFGLYCTRSYWPQCSIVIIMAIWVHEGQHTTKPEDESFHGQIMR